jgi:hypothetical protein
MDDNVSNDTKKDTVREEREGEYKSVGELGQGGGGGSRTKVSIQHNKRQEACDAKCKRKAQYNTTQHNTIHGQEEAEKRRKRRRNTTNAQGHKSNTHKHTHTRTLFV